MKNLLIFFYFLVLNINLSFAAAGARDLGGEITLESLREGVTSTSVRNTAVNVEIDLNDHLRAVLIATIRDQLSGNQNGDLEYEQISEMIYSSYIEIRQIGGRPIALILGKYASNFGTENPRFQNYIYRDEYELTARPGRVLGISVEVNEEILGATFAASVYRPYVGQGEYLGLAGGSYSLKKELIENLVLKYSSMINLDLQSTEIRQSLELVYTTDKFEIWSNVQRFNNVYMAGRLVYGVSFQVGAEYGLTERTSLIVQYSVVENVLSKFETGVEFELREGSLYLFPSVSRYNREGAVENSYRILFTLKF
ncbi:MAG: hypothetical protein EP319_04280 [Deltaproteobacteria bacterium]|nr:MAG: hypothetical protein EP319_04280 [Deltaproteobacteria bacterium]